jgi:amino-acid N-acetyltransferase
MGPARFVSQRGKHMLKTGSRFRSTASQLSKDRDRLKDRHFFETVLGTSTTKREAKSFLSRFNKEVEPAPDPPPTVNLGTLYSPYRAVENTPLFHQYPHSEKQLLPDSKTHVCIVKIQDLESFDQSLLDGVATTLLQLARLGVMSLVVIEASESVHNVRVQCQRMADALVSNGTPEVRIVDQAFITSPQGELTLALPHLLLSPLQRGTIPIIAPLAYSDDSDAKIIDGDKLVIALTGAFATPGTQLAQSTLLDRIIFLGNAGGLPDPKNSANVQSFVNLESEYADIHSRLLSNLLESKSKPHANTKDHLKTLECISRCLSILPTSASALVTTAGEVAESANQASFPVTGVRTRSKRNPLIHNILTDRPMVSSSLPACRMPTQTNTSHSHVTSTVFKRGMPVNIVPDPRFNPWTKPNEASRALTLDKSPDIDFAKLRHLIDDSFNRPLDADAYMSRVHKNLAGIIIAGDYEGGAILTWEQPLNRPGRPPVPYLDKFAVLTRCQGAGGVADVVFNAMVRDCFPDGVVWRSRNSNPVNKWYFERASGVWHIPDSQWTMFWTGTGKAGDSVNNADFKERFEDYVDVCKNIRPTWIDSHKPPN